MLTILAFIITIGILVTVHEYGHFQVARWCGVKVLKFSIGFGRPVWSKAYGKDKTVFAISAIPLGGYVKMLGDDATGGSNPTEQSDRAFNRQSVQKKIAIVLAGPVANLLLAVLLYWGLFLTGVVGLKPVVGDLRPDSPAVAAGMQKEDLVKKINGHNVSTWQEARWVMMDESLEKHQLQVEVLTKNNELHTRHLPMINLDDDIERDILDKLGISIYEPSVPAVIGTIADKSPAHQAGLKSEDLIISIDNYNVSDWKTFVDYIKAHPVQQLSVVVDRNREKIELNIIPEAVEERGQRFGRIGAGLKIDESYYQNYLVTQYYGFAAALFRSIEKTWDTAIFSLKMMGNMVLGNVSWKGMSGPVSIASYAGQSANLGLKTFIGFLALVSISIGVLNLLPIPILDGGHLMYYIVEFFTGKPVSDLAIQIGQRVGFTMLAFIMLLALYNDINRLITG